MNLQSNLENVAQLLPDQSALPELGISLEFLLLFSGFSLVLAILGRAILGKRSSLNRSVSSAMGILFLYAAGIILYTVEPWSLLERLSPLPFFIFAGDQLLLITFQKSAFSVICHELLSLLILGFLLNLLDTLLPRGKQFFSWCCFRLLTVVGAMGVHILVDWAFDTYLPEVLVTYAPVILVILLAGLLLLGVLNFLLGLLLAVFDPILGAIYTFFFSNIIGKQLTKAVATTAVVCFVLFLLGQGGHTLIPITQDALSVYLPFGFAMLLLWFLIGQLL